MILQNLLIHNLRNHEQTGLDFGRGLNVLYGANGSGKTTILEAISICSVTRSFLPVSDSSLIKQGCRFFAVKASAKNDFGLPYNVSIKNAVGMKKDISSTAGDHLNPRDIIGEMPTVVLSPDFKSITFGPPAERRQFVDKTLSQAGRIYMEEMLKLKKCLRQRNNLLGKAKTELHFDKALIEPWTEILIKSGAEIIARRNKFISDFRPFFVSVYEKVSGDAEKVDLKYLPDGIPGDALTKESKPEEIEKMLCEIFEKVADKEFRTGTSKFGPQKDEILFKINGGKAREYASQGQHKSLLISLKFAEFGYLKNIRKETPVILLDDIFSELDAVRSSMALELVKNESAQTFITVTDSESIKRHIPASQDCRFYEIAGGNAIINNSINES